MRILALVTGLLGLALLGVPLALLIVLGLRFQIETMPRVGLERQLFKQRRLNFGSGRLGILANRLGLSRLPDCVSLIRGHLTLVGPRPISPGSPLAATESRASVRPGLVSPFAVRQRAHIAYQPEDVVDTEYIATRSALGDLGLLLRALVARVHGSAETSNLARVEIDGIGVDNLTLDGAVSRIVQFLDGSQTRLVTFVNADCINLAARHPRYRRVLRFSDLVLGDGVGVRIFSRLVGEPLRENVNGTDLFPRLCGALEATSHSVYLLGAAPGVTGAVATWIQSRYPQCRIAGFQNGYFNASEEAEVVEDIRRSGATLLLVAFGAPAQEVWLREHLASSGARVGIGVGGLFDFYSGRIARAPMWMREAGLEWAFRLSREPRRLFWRYGPGNVEFIVRALAAAFRKRQHASHAPRGAH
jgi:N-acetylglucosaminyldiphosphoundecaprenol N-acetyl-beta-D-mannosaminyltransferase